jgi:hypothetical protein
LIKIESLDDPQLASVSRGPFGIFESLSLASPNTGNEVWRVGESQSISWDLNATIDKVHCWYSKDGDDWVRITPKGGVRADQGSGRGSFVWYPVPNIVSDRVIIRVSSVRGDDKPGELFDDSDRPLTVKGKLQLTYPNGGEVLDINSSTPIQWDGKGALGNIRIRFAADGVNFNQVLTPEPGGVPSALGVFTWKPIPDRPTHQARIRIELIADASHIFDDSDDYFFIRPTFALIAPNGGEVFQVGDKTKIVWRTVGTIGNVELRYSTDSGATYPVANLIASDLPQESSPYRWKMPDAVGSRIKVRVASVNDESIADASDKNLTIKQTLELVAPKGGEEWRAETYENIKWRRFGERMGKLKLSYSTGDGKDDYPNTIAVDVDSGDLSYSWRIPDAISKKVRVKIASQKDPKTYDVSQEAFSIRPRIVLSTPVGSEIWHAGDSQNITWTTYGTVDKVSLYYSLDSGRNYDHMIAGGVSNLDGYFWDVPSIISAKARIKVEDFSDSRVFSSSKKDFAIKEKIVLTSPEGKEVWFVGQTRKITWNAFGAIGNVAIRYSEDGGKTFPAANIITPEEGVLASQGAFDWTVPDIIGSDLAVRVGSVFDRHVADESGDSFEVKGVLDLIWPEGGDVFSIGSSQKIRWQSKGSLGDLTIRYSDDSGKSFEHIVKCRYFAILPWISF